ncbi:autotransporter outer membrane beta-barrel domain-containing protein [Helicobacter enhydrae]|nr:autotransporter outer membrane beta-barrel domain-containing protein [Helicobacter enhydrae]
MEGNIKIINNGGHFKNTSHFAFQNDAKLKGNLTTNYTERGQNFTFETGGIEGDIGTYGYYHKQNIQKAATQDGVTSNTEVNITFTGAGASIKKGQGSAGSAGQILADAGPINTTNYPEGHKNNAYNRILFQNNGQIGENGNRMSIIAEAKNWMTGVSEAQNLIQFKGAATLYLDKLQVSEFPASNHRNILSLEGDTNTLDITTIESRGGNYEGRNYIGKGLLKLNGGSEAKDLTIDTAKIDTILESDYYNAIKTATQTLRAKGTLTAGSIRTAQNEQGERTEGGGINGIFIDTLNVTGDDGIASWGKQRNIISANSLTTKRVYASNKLSNGVVYHGTNIIFADTLTISGGVFSDSNKGNHIFIDGNGTIGEQGITSSAETSGNNQDYAIYTKTGGTNNITLGDSATLTIKKKIETASGGTTTFNLNGTNSTLTLQGATNTITKLTANATESTFKLVATNGTTTIATTEIGNGSTLSFQSPNEKIKTDTLKLSTGAKSGKINLSSNAQTNLGTPHNFNLLEIGKTNQADSQSVGLSSSNLTFVVSVDTATKQEGSKIGGVNVGASGGTYGHAYSDRIIVHNVGDNSQAKSANLAVAIDPSQTSSIHYTKGKGTEALDNIAVATIKNKNSTPAGTTDPLVNLTSIETINGGEKIQVEFVKVATDANGKVNGATDNGKAQAGGGYTTYFLGKAISLGVDNTTQQALTSALSINYDLYIANLNSLNKRMGELRDNPYTQGVWARVFGGLQESNFGLGARTSYVTAQGGYDYALETEGAKNYIGLAFSYMHSKGESNKATQASNAINVSGINTIYLSNIQSSGYEIALYNSYVSNVGLYNDTIAKLSYITSDFSLSNSSDHNNTANNLGFTLSNEVGYRFILGEQQDYFIDPQLELSLGYLNQSDFTTKMKTRSGKGNQLKALQESVFLTRTRLGASFGKKIVEQDKNISLYVGTFYEYDLVTGGSNKLTTSTTKAYNPEFASNGRVVLNVGSNLELNQSTRVYVDVEKSFGDKLRTQLQFNLGARYSFGEKTSIENIKAQTTAPLRVGNTPTEETEKDQIVPTISNKAKDTRAKAANQ